MKFWTDVLIRLLLFTQIVTLQYVSSEICESLSTNQKPESVKVGARLLFLLFPSLVVSFVTNKSRRGLRTANQRPCAKLLTNEKPCAKLLTNERALVRSNVNLSSSSESTDCQSGDNDIDIGEKRCEH